MTARAGEPETQRARARGRVTASGVQDRAGQQVPGQPVAVGGRSPGSHYNDGKSGVESQQINKQIAVTTNRQTASASAWGRHTD